MQHTTDKPMSCLSNLINVWGSGVIVPNVVQCSCLSNKKMRTSVPYSLVFYLVIGCISDHYSQHTSKFGHWKIASVPTHSLTSSGSIHTIPDHCTLFVPPQYVL